MGLYDGKTTKEIQDVIFNQCRPEIKRFAIQMENKFRVYQDRGDPFDPKIPYYFLHHRLFQEIDEFIDAIESGKPSSDVIQEGADVANFLCMMVEWYRRERYKRK